MKKNIKILVLLFGVGLMCTNTYAKNEIYQWQLNMFPKYQAQSQEIIQNNLNWTKPPSDWKERYLYQLQDYQKTQQDCFFKCTIEENLNPQPVPQDLKERVYWQIHDYHEVLAQGNIDVDWEAPPEEKP